MPSAPSKLYAGSVHSLHLFFSNSLHSPCFLCRRCEPSGCDARHQSFLLGHFPLPLRRVPLPSNSPSPTTLPLPFPSNLNVLASFPRYSPFSTRSCSSASSTRSSSSPPDATLAPTSTIPLPNGTTVPPPAQCPRFIPTYSTISKSFSLGTSN